MSLELEIIKDEFKNDEEAVRFLSTNQYKSFLINKYGNEFTVDHLMNIDNVHRLVVISYKFDVVFKWV